MENKIKNLLLNKSYVNLDIGGGRNPQKGFLTMDKEDLKGVDLVWDYQNLPYPFPDKSVNLIRADGVIAHISRENNKFISFMNECWRILKDEGQFMIATCYAGSYEFYRDPGNINPVNEATFTYFDPLEPLAGKFLYKIYKPKPWKIMNICFRVNADMEVLLEKRRVDTSYEED